ncbi:MAG TPA: M56 family metallopeptidase, partial [Fimbriimonadaceae bacterium]|nr:M56 family metallopeptidase [Fimbriimonadaceae bacterium]
VLALPALELTPVPSRVAAWQVPAGWTASSPPVRLEPAGGLSSTPAASAQVGGSPFPWIASTWLGGAALILLQTGIAVLLLRRRGVQSSPMAGREAIVLSAAEAMGVRRWDVRLGDVQVAMTWGLFRPFVLLPRGASEWSDERLRIVLLHEFAHAARRDYLWRLLASVATALYWFHPLAWLAAARMRSAAEDAADDLVIAGGIEAPRYAEELIAIAGEVRGRMPAPGSGVAIVRGSQLGSRIRTILDSAGHRPTKAGHLALAGLLCLGALGFASACRPISPQKEKAAVVYTPPTKDIVPQAIGKGVAKRVLGQLAQATEACSIHLKPKADTQVLYKVKPYDYLVAVSYNAGWDKILLQNGTYGYAQRSKIAHLPYQVTAGDAWSPERLRAFAKIPMKATSYIGRPIDSKLRGGGFIHEVFGDKVPADVGKQSESGKPVTRLEELKAGDRVYFWDDKADRIGWGGVFIGSGYFVGPLPGHREIAVAYLGEKKWLKSLVAARR